MSNNGNIYLIDFGVANELVSNETGTVVGKQAYMAPEQVRGKANEQSDIYSLGATMYFLATGQEPPALTHLATKKIVQSISAQLDQLIANCTELEIEDRRQLATQFIHKIEKHKQKAPSLK